MNAHPRNLDVSISEHLDAELSKMIGPEEQAERLATGHRNMVAKSSQRLADTRKNLKARLAGYEADKRALRAAFDRDTAFLAELIAEAKDQAERDTSADKRIVAASKAALDALMAE